MIGSRVLVVGDANPDLVLRGDVVPRFGQAEQLLEECSLVIGGSAGITAHAFARLGRPVSLVAAVGGDLFGAQLVERLEAVGVDLAGLRRRAGVPTGLSVVLSGGDDRAILTLPGAIPTLTVAEVLESVAELPDARHVHVSSFFLQPVLAAGLGELLAELHGAGLTVSLDTNADPAGEWAGVVELLASVDVLLPNRSEAVALGGDPDPLAAAAALAAHGPLVVVKDGAAGAHAVRAGAEPVSEPGRPAEVVDTTGAGDTFDAGFLDAWLDDEPLTECLRRAVLAGALSVRASGGTAAQPTRDQLLGKDPTQ